MIALMWISKQQFTHRLQIFDLTHPQFVTLASLAAHKQPCMMSEITQVTLQDPPTMTGIINRLVRMELVKRSRSEADRRVVLVQATAKGIALIKQIEEELMQDYLNFYATLSEEEQKNFEQSLTYLLRMYALWREIDLDTEIEKAQQFMNDPISFFKQDNGRFNKTLY